MFTLKNPKVTNPTGMMEVVNFGVEIDLEGFQLANDMNIEEEYINQLGHSIVEGLRGMGIKI